MSSGFRRALQGFLVFLPMAAIGTVSHELGHVLAARASGVGTVLHYGSTEWLLPDSGLSTRDEAWMLLGGPASTVALGTAGFVWLLRLRARVPADAPLRVRGWIATLLALFWSRQVFNAAVCVVAFAVLGTWPTTDETTLAVLGGLSEWITVWVPCLVGFLVCAAVVVRLHPVGHRLAFAVGGSLGALAGFALWYGPVGPRLLP